MGLTRSQLRSVCAGVLLLAFSFAQSAAAPRRESTRVPTILVLGDSLSDGFSLARSEAYPALLAQRLRAAGLDYTVVNASASGGTTADGLRRIGNHLARPIDIFILELGINDVFLGLPVPKIRANLQSIIDRVKAKNPRARVVIAGMQFPITASDRGIESFGQMYAELARENEAALVPYLLEGVGGNPRLNLPDRIHPNAEGQKILAENVWRVLEPLVRQAKPTRATVPEL